MHFSNIDLWSSRNLPCRENTWTSVCGPSLFKYTRICQTLLIRINVFSFSRPPPLGIASDSPSMSWLAKHSTNSSIVEDDVCWMAIAVFCASRCLEASLTENTNPINVMNTGTAIAINQISDLRAAFAVMCSNTPMPPHQLRLEHLASCTHRLSSVRYDLYFRR